MRCTSGIWPALRGRPFLCVSLLLWACLASGHGGESNDSGKVRAVLDAIPKTLQGVRIQLRRTLAPQLLVENTTDKQLTVLDQQGRAFLRIGPGRTEGDLGDVAFHRTNTSTAAGKFKPGDSTQPNWQVVQATPNWGWFDLRLRTDGVAVPHAIVDADEKAKLAKWSIPVTFGDSKTSIDGYFEYVPAPKGVIQARVTDAGALTANALIRVLNGVSRPGLFISWRGDKPLTVIGGEGEAFLRYSDSGVEVNRRSATWAQAATAGKPKPVRNDGNKSPLWARISKRPDFGWIDPRLGYSGEIENPNRYAIVDHWAIPVRVGEEKRSIKGEIEWQPNNPENRKSAEKLDARIKRR